MFSLLSVILTLFLSVTEIVPDGERLYLGGDAYSAPTVYQRDNGGNWTAYNIGRFLSPDPYIQSPDFTQNFNRYSYCLNNPLKYTDESGEFIFTTAIIVGICVGTAIGAGGSIVPKGTNAASIFGALKVGTSVNNYSFVIWRF